VVRNGGSELAANHNVDPMCVYRYHSPTWGSLHNTISKKQVRSSLGGELPPAGGEVVGGEDLAPPPAHAPHRVQRDVVQVGEDNQQHLQENLFL